MTKIILDPLNLRNECQGASDEKSFKVRIIGQVLNYDESTACLLIRKIPFSSTNATSYFTNGNEEGLKINLFLVLERVDIELISPGSIVNIIGFYNGVEVNVVDCYSINGFNILSSENINILIQTSSIEEFEKEA